MRFPQRVFEVGIAEQNAVGIAAGLAASGLIPYVGTYAGFLTMRACEQMRTFVAYPHLPVRFVGLNGGLLAGEREGVTHQFFEDLGIVRTVPGLTVVVPADGHEAYRATQAIAYVDGPAYLRLGSGREADIFDEDEPFELGSARMLSSTGDDVAIFATGLVLNRAQQAVRELAGQGIGAVLVEVHTLKPLDGEQITAVLQRTGAAVTVEDHNIIGGLGSAIAEHCAEACPVPVARVGLRDMYPESGEAESLLDAYGMSVSDIVAAARRALALKSAGGKHPS